MINNDQTNTYSYISESDSGHTEIETSDWKQIDRENSRKSLKTIKTTKRTTTTPLGNRKYLLPIKRF